jgi:hypothetical protein
MLAGNINTCGTQQKHTLVIDKILSISLEFFTKQQLSRRIIEAIMQKS